MRAEQSQEMSAINGSSALSVTSFDRYSRPTATGDGAGPLFIIVYSRTDGLPR